MYQDFSIIYDKLVFDIDYDFYQKLIKNHIKFHSNMKVLELGCGTGNITSYFLTDDYTGIDLSQEMLDISKRKFPNNKYYCEDISRYCDSNEYDLIFTTLDTINYLLDISDIKRLFQNVKKMLKSSGYFIFDINSSHKLRDILGNHQYVYEHEDIFYTWTNQYYPTEDIVDFFLDFFVKKGDLYQRIHEEQTEKVYEVSEIKGCLQKCGFQSFICDFDTGNKIENKTQRILFINQKETNEI